MPQTASGFCQRMATTRSGMRTAAVSSRAARLLTRRPGSFWRDRPQLDLLLGGEPEAALAALVHGDRVHEVGAPEVGPHRVREVELGVGHFPEQEVRQPLLA